MMAAASEGAVRVVLGCSLLRSAVLDPWPETPGIFHCVRL